MYESPDGINTTILCDQDCTMDFCHLTLCRNVQSNKINRSFALISIEKVKAHQCYAYNVVAWFNDESGTG